MTALDLSTLEETAPSSTGVASADARQNLIDYASLGGFTLTAETHAWYAAVDAVGTPEEARAASTVLAELRGRDLPATREAATRLAEETTLGRLDTVVAVGRALALTLRVKSTLEVLVPTAYESEHLATFAAATGSGQWRREQGAKLSWTQRRNLTRTARELAVAARPRRGALHAALAAATAERADWAALSQSEAHPVLPGDLGFLDASVQAVDAACEALAELGRLAVDANPAALTLDELTGLVDRLASDEGTLYRLPELRALRVALEEQGYGELVAELTAARADATAVAEAVAREFGAVDEDEAVEPATATAAAPAEATATAPETTQPLVPAPREEEPAVSEAAPETEAATTEPEAEVVAEVEVAEVVAEVEVAEAVAEPEVTEPEVAQVATEAVVAEAEVTEPAEPATPEAETETVAEVEVAEVVTETAVAEAEVTEVAEPAVAPAEVAAEPVAETVPAEVEAVEVEAVEVAEDVAVAPAAVTEAAPVADVAVVAETLPIGDEAAAAPKAKAKPRAKKPVAPAADSAELVAEPARPGKPAFTPGRPVTAYSADELVSVVAWIDGDGVKRSDDELLRAAMKEFGFARLGPRIKDALGAAIAAVRA